jgi:CheY-like chemotaxis protein
MPGMTGWEVLRRLRDSDLANIPVIVLSARESPEDVAEGLAFGVRSYLGKTAGSTGSSPKCGRILAPPSGSVGTAL